MANGSILDSFLRGKQQKATLEQFKAEAAQQERLSSLLGQIDTQPQQVPQLGVQPVQPGARPFQPVGLEQPLGVPQAPAQPLGIDQPQQPITQQVGVSNTQALAQLAIEFPEQFKQVNVNLGLITQQQKNQAADFAFKLKNTPFPQRNTLIQQRVNELEGQGRNANDTRELIDLPENQQNNALDTVQIAALSPQERAKIARGEELTAGQKEFASLTEGLSPEKKKEAALIKLGLSARAVGSAAQTIADEGTAEAIGDSEAILRERGKFGELKATARTKAIDSGIQAIQKIDKNVRNIDRAIEAVQAGAGVGAIERRFPSIKAASVLLDQIQGELALDVVGAVSFGALLKLLHCHQSLQQYLHQLLFEQQILQPLQKDLV